MATALQVTGHERQRLSDVANASWPEFDFRQKLWTIPAARYKTGAAQVVPLTKEMLALLDTLPHFDSGEFLFSASWGRTPVANFSKPKLRLDARMRKTLPKLPDWVVHDIRRTVRSQLSALPVEQHVRELVIGHAKPGLHKVTTSISTSMRSARRSSCGKHSCATSCSRRPTT